MKSLDKALAPAPSDKLDTNWLLLSRLWEQHGRIIKQFKGKRFLLEVENDDSSIPGEFWKRTKIGSEPAHIERYVRLDKYGRRGVTRNVFRWRAGKQLEVYWFLSNLARFLRGPKRRRVEEALHFLEAHLTHEGALKHVGIPALDPERFCLSKAARSPNFLSRSHL